MGYALIVVIAYLMGSSSMAYYLSKAKKVDLRAGGSGNLGTSNTVLLMGWRAAIVVAIHDIGKGVLAVILAELIFPQLAFAGAAAGVACVLGHIFPFYLKFRGGKGFATYIGMTIALSWKLALVVLVLVLIITLVTDYLALGTFAAITVVPVWLGIATRSFVLPVILLLATMIIFLKHRENIVRMIKGTEIGLRSALKGEHKVK